MSTTNTDDPLDILDRAHAASTGGEWRHDGIPWAKGVHSGLCCDDADFIVAAHNMWPAVAEEMRRLRSDVDELRKALQAEAQWSKDYDALVEKSSRWMHDSTQWDQSDFEYANEWQELWGRSGVGARAIAKLDAARGKVTK